MIMEKSIKYLGLSIILSAILICSTLLVTNFMADRYYLNDTHLLVLDKMTGKVYDVYGQEIKK